jgi:hypothetical protein
MVDRECRGCADVKSAESFPFVGVRRSLYCTPCQPKKLERRRLVSADWSKRERQAGRSAAKQYQYRRVKVAKVLLLAARCRSKKYGLVCSITENDVVVPTHCPVLGIALTVGEGRCSANSPTLDRIDSTRGYVPGNIIVISHRANTIKSNATLEEIAAVLRFYVGLTAHASASENAFYAMHRAA